MYKSIHVLFSFHCYSTKIQIKNQKLNRRTVFGKNITVITDPEGKKIVLINDIRFKGKTKEEWNDIEFYLKEYIGKYYEISETSEKVYIGVDFPDEFTHGKDKTVLKGMV